MAERTVPIEFNDANIRAARKFKAQRDALVKALEQIADPMALDVNGVGVNRALNLIHRMAEIAKDALAPVGRVNANE